MAGTTNSRRELELFSSFFNQENFLWTYEAVRNCCDKDLQVIIDAKMLKYKSFERFEPLYYYELFQQMTTVDSKAVRAIAQELATLKVPNHEGQSICKVAKCIRSTFERVTKSCGKKIKNYHGDNGVFKSNKFGESLIDQELDLSGVGAHHQNGVAERSSIRTVTEKARSMMQHAFLHWPDEFEVDLWPFVLDHACWLHNHTPKSSHGWAPIEIFCGTQVACKHLQRVRVWGRPGNVLNPTLQDGKKIPKWAPKARRGQFLGFSWNHSSTIGLLRNLQTGSINPQFHVVFDELFTTVHSVDEDDETWIELFVSEREYYGPDEEEEVADTTVAFPDVDPEWLPIFEQPLPQQLAPPAAPHDPGDDFDTGVEDNPDFEDLPELIGPVAVEDNATAIIENKRIRRPNKRIFGDEWVNHTV